MKQISSNALRVALLIVIVMVMVAPVLLPGTAPVAYAGPGDYHRSYENSWTVHSSTGMNTPDDPNRSDAADCAHDANESANDWEVIYDLGSVHQIDQIFFSGSAAFLNIYYSEDLSVWDGVNDGQFVAGGDFCPSSWLEDIGTSGIGHPVRYIQFWGTGALSGIFLHFYGYREGDASAGTATPTVTPTPAFATPLPPQPTACVTATARPTATHLPTPTPFVARTPTPGGPTATPGPTATGTPLPSFDSGVANFAQSMQPWTASEHFQFGGLYVTEWRSTNGPDGDSGVAFTKDFVGLLDNPAGPLTTTEPLSGSLTFSRPSGMFFPFRVTGSVKWSASMLGGESAYLRAWYFDPDYISPGQGAWVTDPPNWRKQFSANWDHFSFSMVQHGGSGRVTAVAISEELDGTERAGEGALLDNLRVFSGPQAVSGSFPTCQGSGAGSHPVVTKVCIIKQISVDVISRGCTAPTSLIDLWNWIVYAVCRIENYFTWFAENTQQINTLKDRQNADEPFGTFFEASDMIGVISGVIRDIASTYANNASEYRQINWHTFFDFRQLDAIANVFQVPNDPDILARYRARCPALPSEEMNSQLFAKYGCLVLTFTRDQLPVFGVWQWVIDVSSIIGLIIYAQRILSKK